MIEEKRKLGMTLPTPAAPVANTVGFARGTDRLATPPLDTAVKVADMFEIVSCPTG